MTKAIFNWSGGKDSAMCLYKILQTKQYDVMCLLTSISEQYQRISMHGVRVDLLNTQAESIGLPLLKMQIPEMPAMEIYDKIMTTTASIFGDIFLEDLRRYRENKLSELNLKGIFPLWKIPTDKLLREFIDLGFKTIVTCVNEKYLDKSFAGRIIDNNFLKDLPKNVDPCGEIVYKKYTPAKEKDNSTHDWNISDKDKADSPFNNGFWYCDLSLP